MSVLLLLSCGYKNDFATTVEHDMSFNINLVHFSYKTINTSIGAHSLQRM